MKRQIAVLALLSCVACYSADPSVGTCNVAADCKLPDGGPFPGATCTDNRCSYACTKVCGGAEACVNGQCISQGPAIGTVTVVSPAPPNWARASDMMTVTAVVDDTQGPSGAVAGQPAGIASATLQIQGQPDIAGATIDTGLARTYTFTVNAGTVQASDSETPVDFTILATDNAGHATPSTGWGRGQLLIDRKPPSLASGVTVNFGILGGAPPQIKWFPYAATGDIDVQVTLADSGSGVDSASLQLMEGVNRFDHGTPTCTAGQTTQQQVCHFTVAKSYLGAGNQGRIQFGVVAGDKTGNALPGNTAALGIDGTSPTITFSVGTTGTTTIYPGAGTDCAADVQACGHDGSHFFRSGDGKYTFKFKVDDGTNGSGPDPNGSTCAIAGVSTCSVTYDTTSGTFQFPAELSQATVTTTADGTGTVSSIKVTGKDLVGNPGTDVTLTSVAVNRVKWIRKEAVNLSTAPVLSEQMGLVIVGGSVTSGDSIFAVNTMDGSRAWKAGSASPAVGTITGSLAIDSTASTDTSHPTPVLYANGGTQAFAMHFTTTGVDKYCSQSPSTTSMVGSPVIFGGGASAYAIAGSQDTLVAFQTALSASGGGCLRPTFYPQTIPNPSPLFGPPSANGSTIYWGYDNSSSSNPTDLGVMSIGFNGVFESAAKTAKLGFAPTAAGQLAAVTPSSDVFFGVNSQVVFYDYAPDLSGASGASYKWKSQTGLSSVAAQPLISNSVVYGSTKALYAFKIGDGTYAWSNPAVTGSSKVSAPTFASSAIFVGEDSGPSFGAYDLNGTNKWIYKPTSVTAISGVPTEATFGSGGVVYFGDAVGHIYALFSDTTSLARGATDWPRTGYDNCNSNHSNNPGFVCQ